MLWESRSPTHEALALPQLILEAPGPPLPHHQLPVCFIGSWLWPPQHLPRRSSVSSLLTARQQQQPPCSEPLEGARLCARCSWPELSCCGSACSEQPFPEKPSLWQLDDASGQPFHSHLLHPTLTQHHRQTYSWPLPKVLQRLPSALTLGTNYPLYAYGLRRLPQSGPSPAPTFSPYHPPLLLGPAAPLLCLEAPDALFMATCFCIPSAPKCCGWLFPISPTVGSNTMDSPWTSQGLAEWSPPFGQDYWGKELTFQPAHWPAHLPLGPGGPSLLSLAPPRAQTKTVAGPWYFLVCQLERSASWPPLAQP